MDNGPTRHSNSEWTAPKVPQGTGKNRSQKEWTMAPQDVQVYN